MKSAKCKDIKSLCEISILSILRQAQYDKMKHQPVNPPTHQPVNSLTR